MKFLLLPFLAAVLSAQTVIDGRVVDAVSGAPVTGAYVGGGSGDAGPITDSAGHFRINVNGKWATLLVKRNGYLVRWQNFELGPGHPTEVSISVVPQSVISGRVLDENGLPVGGARVSALYYREVDGRRALRPWRGSVVTNERGEYRIFEMPAGRYYLGVTPEKLSEWNPRYGTRLYPDATDLASAEVFEIHAGEELNDRDFRLTPMEGATVSGRLTRSQSGSVRLFLESTEFPDYSVPVTLSGGGVFSIAHVPPGNYRLRTWRNTLQPRIGDLMGDIPVQVGRTDVRDLNVEIRPIAEQDISGKVEFLGRTRPGLFAVTLRRELGDEKSAVSSADGSFVIKGILPGRHFLDARDPHLAGVTPSDGTIVRYELGGRDVTLQNVDIGMEPPGALKITVTAPVAKISGTLFDAAGHPLNDGRILFLPRADGFRSNGYPREDGSFTASIFSVGEHRVYVVQTPEEMEMLRDPEYLRAHENDFPPVKIVEGANPPLTLRMSAQ